jgi:hypothetical protein
VWPPVSVKPATRRVNSIHERNRDFSTVANYNICGVAKTRVAPHWRQAVQATFDRLKKWLVTWEHRLDFWPTFKGTLAAHEWTIYPFFMLLVVIFLLLLPRACRYP